MDFQHPFFAFDNEELTALKTRIQTDAACRAQYDAAVKDRDKLLAEAFLTEEYANSVYDQHGKFYEVAWQIDGMRAVLGAKWLIEGDISCARKLRDLLMHVSAFRCWAGPDNPYQPVPRKSELTTGEIALAAAGTFDILYGYLSPEERKTVADAIFAKGIMPLMEDWVLPETRIHAMDSMGHNWWAVCIAMGASALLPLAGFVDNDCREHLLDAAEDALESFLVFKGDTLFNKPASFDEQGLFYESVGYFNFGVSEILNYIYRAERYRGRREKLRRNLPKEIDKAILAFAYPTEKTPGVWFLNYGDGETDVDIYPLLSAYSLLGYGSPAQRAYFERRHQWRSFHDLFHPELFGPGNWEDLPLTSVFPQTGYAFTRNAWGDDQTLFSVRCGYTWNHAHADAGHFILWHRGEALIPDGGKFSYTSPLYRTYFCKDEGHNVLLVGGEGQVPEDQYRGSKFHGRIFDSFTGPDFVYFGADATGPLAHLCCRAYRNFLWIGNRVLVIIDDVRSHKENTVQFLLHHAGTWERGDADGLPRTRITGEKSALDVYNVWPADTTCKEVLGCRIETGDGVKEAKHLAYSTVTPAQSTLLITVLALDPDENPVSVRALTCPDARGVELAEGDTGLTRRIWFNLQADGRRMHLNSNALIDGFDTDAYFFMRTLAPGGDETDFLTAASFHRRPGTAGFAAYIKQTALYIPDHTKKLLR